MVLLAAHAVFARTDILSGVLGFRPGAGLIPWAAAWAGGWAVPAVALASWIGEMVLSGQGPWIAAGTAIGWALWAALAAALLPRAGRYGRLGAAGLGMAAAAWTAWAVEVRGWYPFAWVWGLAAIHHVGFALVLWPVTRVNAARFRAGVDWVPMARILGFGIGPSLILLAVSRWAYGPGPWTVPMLGETTGRGFVTLALLALLAPVLLRVRRQTRQSPHTV